MDAAICIVVFRKESDGWKFFAATAQKVVTSSLDEKKCWPVADIPQDMVDTLEYELFKK
jgi:hypothetical protein